MNLAKDFPLRRRASVLAGVAASLACVVTVAGSAQAATTSIFGTTWHMPRNIQIDSKGNLYIANFAPAMSFDSTDGDNGRWWLSKITPGGVSTPNWTQVGAAPNMIVFDSQENIYTVNELSYSVTKTTPDGVSNIMWGLTDETIPASLTIDSKGNIYTGNYFGSNVSKITPSGVSTKNWAPAGTNPDAIIVDSDDNIYVTNQGSDNISKITPDGTSTVNWGPGGAEVKTGRKPYMVVFDSAGNLYSVNYTSQNVSKITPDGRSTVNWGPGGAEVSTLGTKPITITIDSAGNLYTGDHGADNVTKITPEGVATKLVDLGNAPLAPGTTPVFAPRGITIDSAGNLYTANQTSENVSKITPTVTNGTPDIFPAPPARPSAPTATSGTLGPGTATVSVTANPVSAAFGTPTSYTITATQDASKQCVVTSPATSCTVTGLTVGTAYTFTARANLNSWHTAASAASNSVGAIVMPGSALTPPVATVTNLASRMLPGGRTLIRANIVFNSTDARASVLLTGSRSTPGNGLRATAPLGDRVPMLRGSTLGTRVLTRSRPAITVTPTAAKRAFTLRAIANRKRLPSGSMLRIIMRTPDGTLVGQDVRLP